MKVVSGLAACLVVAIAAFFLGRLAPVVGAPVFAIVLGLIVANVRRPPAVLAPGIAWSGKYLLQVAIVLMGLNLSIVRVVRSGLASLPVTIVTLALTLGAAAVIGKALKVDVNIRRLLGAGTAICGGSAIAALSGVIEATQDEVAYAIATVFLFNVVAVVVFPLLGHAMHLSQQAFGLWAGTAINDTSSVVAASVSYGHESGVEGVIVKVTRTVFILPIVLFYAAKKVFAARAARAQVAWVRIVPWFVLWFLLAAVANTLGAVPAPWAPALGWMAAFSIVVALAGVGLSADFAKMRAAGLRPLALGAVLWALIAGASLVTARLFHVA